MTSRCAHGFDHPEKTCSPCRDRIALGQSVQLNPRARAPKPVHEDPVTMIEVVDDAAVHRGRAPTIEEIREAGEDLSKRSQNIPENIPIDERPRCLPHHPDDPEGEEETVEEEKAVCGKCGEPKPLTEEFFYKSKSCKSGFSTSKCKACRKVYEAAMKKERSKERAKKYIVLPAKKPGAAPGPPPGIAALQELQAAIDDRVSDIRKLHMAMMTVRKIYGLEYEIKIPSLVG